MGSHLLLRRRLAPMVVSLAVVLGVSACGSSGPSTGTGQSTRTFSGSTAPQPTDGSTEATAVRESDLRFAKCMRGHGVSDFPDPNDRGVFPVSEIQSLKQTLSGSPEAKAAYAACKGELPSPSSLVSSPQAKADAVQFAECMRAHGVTSFPDPGSQTNPSAGAPNLNSPQSRRAARDCQSLVAPLAGKASR